MGNEDTLNAIFTIGYLFFVFCFVAPPTEFVSAGLTIQNVLSNYLGSEQLHFIEYHMKRTAVTLLVHSLLPLGYYVGIGLFSPQLGLFTPWNLGLFWKIYLSVCIFIIFTCNLLFYLWTRNKYNSHPIAKELALLGNGTSSWRAVASSINVEFRRVDKFTTGTHGRRVIVTDSWVILTSTYYVYIAHQNDIHLALSKSEEHDIHYESMTSVQFLKFNVISINPALKPFSIRLNALEYKDLKEKLTTPIVNARNIVIKQSLSDQFLDAFRHQVNLNHVFHMPDTMRKHRDMLIQENSDQVQQQTLSGFIKQGKYKPTDPKQQQITDALLMFTAGDLLPVSVVDSDNFKSFMETLDSKYQIPSQKHLTTKLLHEKSTEVQNNLKHQLKKAQSICLTIDMWSSRQMKGFLGMTAVQLAVMTSALAKKYLTILATSAPVERLFSVAGKVLRPERCRLNDSTFEKLLMIKCNGNISK